MRDIFQRIVDRFRRKNIFKYAVAFGKDVDGDIIVYKGAVYYVHLLDDVIVRV